MARFNFFKMMKYGAAFMTVMNEVTMALADARLTPQEALKIIKVAVRAADIKGLDVHLIEINPREDGGFTLEFPHAAIKDWAIDFVDDEELAQEA